MTTATQRPAPRTRTERARQQPVPLLGVPRQPELRGPAPRRVRWSVASCAGVGLCAVIGLALCTLPAFVTITKNAHLVPFVFPALGAVLVAVGWFAIGRPARRAAELLRVGRVCNALVEAEAATLAEHAADAAATAMVFAGNLAAAGSDARVRRVTLRIRVSPDREVRRSRTFLLSGPQEWCEPGTLVTALVHPDDDSRFEIYEHARSLARVR